MARKMQQLPVLQVDIRLHSVDLKVSWVCRHRADALDGPSVAAGTHASVISKFLGRLGVLDELLDIVWGSVLSGRVELAQSGIFGRTLGVELLACSVRLDGGTLI